MLKHMNKFIVLCILSCGLLCSACMDFEPEDKMGDNQVWNSQDNFQYA